MIARLTLLLALLLALTPGAVLAEPAPFDLAGPGLEVKVTRAGATLPISQTPDLAAGDQLWIKADLPPGQSAHYLLVAAFLRGATNPPPKSWFHQSQTWSRKGAAGMTVTVPAGAQQVLLFLAPETGGDFKTLVNAVRSRPGAFVRASQDLHQATLDRSRLDAFLAAIRQINEVDPSRLKEASPLLARSLTIKLDADCLRKTIEIQAPCLVQGRDSLVLNDGHTTSMVQALTSGYSAELVQQLSYTPRAGSGYYSPYIASIMDIAHIMDSIHTARYQYIPTLATSQDDRLSLLLNAPPSFQDPKSVLVVALPEVETTDLPPLHPVNDNEAFCAQKPGLVLPVEGAPLVFSTRYAHDMVLRLVATDGRPLDLPVKTEPEKGGFSVDTAGLDAGRFGEVVPATLQGRWGFAPYKGPEFKIQMAKPRRWEPARDDQRALLGGGETSVRVGGTGAACVESIQMQLGSAKPKAVTWTAPAPNELSVKVPLGKSHPQSLNLLVKQYGLAAPDQVALLPVSHGSRVDSLELHADDPVAVLRGTSLEDVARVTLGGTSFMPGVLVTKGVEEELSLDAGLDAKLPSAGDAAEASVVFKNGHTSTLEITVAPPRPRVSLIEKSFRLAEPQTAQKIQLGDKDLIPQGSQLTFSIRAEAPEAFRGDEKVEVAGADGPILATLTPSAGLVFADRQVAIATLDTGKAFNASTAGALRFRIVRGDAPGSWLALGVLVRLPHLEGLKCPSDAKKPCALAGSDLFLVSSLSSSPSFRDPTEIPQGFTAATLDAPRPTGGRLYMKLHDAPSVVNVVTTAPQDRAH